MNRLDKLLFAIHRKSRILEIGPSYNPAAPKAAGWQTRVLDHASQAELQAKYMVKVLEDWETVRAAA
jgi:hypothetical protein